MDSKKIGGIWPALLTPVDKNGDPAMKELEALVELFVKQELDGLYILGSTGQGFLFSEKQRNEIAKRVIDVAAGRFPVIVQVGAMNPNESIRLAKEAQKMGAYGVSTVGPIYYQAGMDKIIAHYKMISSSIDIPFFAYHIGNHSIFGGSATEYIGQMLSLPNITGMKLTTDNLYEVSLISKLSEGKLCLFSGAEELLCQAALSGVAGNIGSYFNLWGVECKSVRTAFLNGNIDLANKFMSVFSETVFKTLPDVWSFFRKAILMRYGIDTGIPNPPMGLLTNREWKENEILKIFDEIESAGKI
ncbi:MAG: dihydrodipicolinate synthase family protein [Chitinophagaceae bacterium]|nr:dihydrodipicolinate synthase family protein [Chitinophagaceae bacterium]